jgi:hypothetical protein
VSEVGNETVVANCWQGRCSLASLTVTVTIIPAGRLLTETQNSKQSLSSSNRATFRRRDQRDQIKIEPFEACVNGLEDLEGCDFLRSIASES